jgi:RHS repeat-associated protein
VYVDAMVLRDRATTTPGTLDERLLAQQDANWNVTAVVDGTGAVVERYAYDPFGGVTVLTPSYGSRSGSSYGWVYQHQGLRDDTTAGLYEDRNRWYSPTMGRFVSTDPIRFFAGDINLYRVVGNGPTNSFDPTGLVDPDELWRAAYNYYRTRGDSDAFAREEARKAYNFAQNNSEQMRQLALDHYLRLTPTVEAIRAEEWRRAAPLVDRMTAQQQDARRAAAAAAAAATERRAALLRMGVRGGATAGLAVGLVTLAAQDPGPPEPGARLVDRVNETNATVETWDLPGGGRIRRSIDVNGEITMNRDTSKR